MLTTSLGLRAQELQYARRSLGQDVGKGTISTVGPETRVAFEDSEVVVRAILTADKDGWLLHASREIRRKDADFLVGRITVSREGSGYSIREQGPLGARTRWIAGSGVRTILDPACPEWLVPVLLAERKGLLGLLALARESVINAEVRELSPVRRTLDIATGMATLETDSSGAFQRLAIEGATALEIVAIGVAPEVPPPGVTEERFRLRLQGVEVEAVLSRPDPCPSECVGVLLLGDAQGQTPDAVNPSSTGRPILRDIAWSLATRGRISLRHARRDQGTGDLGLEALRRDAEEAVRFLALAPGVAPAAVGVLGHGEGAQVALALARTGREAGIRGALLLGLPMRKLDAVLADRLLRDLRARGEIELGIADALTALREDLKELVTQPETVDPGQKRRLLRDLLRVDPMEAVTASSVPLLILQGERDAAITGADRALLPTATLFATARQVRSRVVEDADHEFRATSGARHPDLLPLLEAFLKEFFPLPSPVSK